MSHRGASGGVYVESRYIKNTKASRMVTAGLMLFGLAIGFGISSGFKLTHTSEIPDAGLAPAAGIFLGAAPALFCMFLVLGVSCTNVLPLRHLNGTAICLLLFTIVIILGIAVFSWLLATSADLQFVTVNSKCRLADVVLSALLLLIAGIGQAMVYSLRKQCMALQQESATATTSGYSYGYSFGYSYSYGYGFGYDFGAMPRAPISRTGMINSMIGDSSVQLFPNVASADINEQLPPYQPQPQQLRSDQIFMSTLSQQQPQPLPPPPLQLQPRLEQAQVDFPTCDVIEAFDPPSYESAVGLENK